MSDGVNNGSECEAVGRTGQGCDVVERGKAYEAVGRVGERQSEVAG